jgi:hypothetical protein
MNRLFNIFRTYAVQLNNAPIQQSFVILIYKLSAFSLQKKPASLTAVD